MEERPTRKGRGINKTIIDGRVQHKSMEKQIEDGKKRTRRNRRGEGHGKTKTQRMNESATTR
jgi:hypothetical protein